MQDAIFDAFGELLCAIIEDARQAGTLDVGLETLRAERFVITDRKVIFEHEATGSDGNGADGGANGPKRAADAFQGEVHLRQNARGKALLERDLEARGPDDACACLHG